MIGFLQFRRVLEERVKPILLRNNISHIESIKIRLNLIVSILHLLIIIFHSIHITPSAYNATMSVDEYNY